MEQQIKNKTIELMKQLLDYAKNLPIFLVEFDITANIKNIEEYIITHADKEDWEGNPLTDDEISNNIYNAIKRVHNKAYNSSGVFTLTMRKFFTIQDILYDNIYEIVSGNCKDMPKEYTFIGEFKLVDFSS